VGEGAGVCDPWPSPPHKPATPPGHLRGTFDPIHYGHLRAGEEVAEALGLSQLWFMPASVPPHKARPMLTPYGARLAMARLAVGEHLRLAVSDLEGRRPGKSYTVETLRLVREEMGPAGELYYVLGLDAILEISTWRNFRELFTLSHFVVLDRPGYARDRLARVLQEEVDPGFRALPTGEGFAHPVGSECCCWPPRGWTSRPPASAAWPEQDAP